MAKVQSGVSLKAEEVIKRRAEETTAAILEAHLVQDLVQPIEDALLTGIKLIEGYDKST
jgi:hypothetical protein